MANVKRKTIGDRVGRVINSKPKIKREGLSLTKIGRMFKVKK